MHSARKATVLLLLLVSACASPAMAASFLIEPEAAVHWGYLGEHLFTNDASVANPQTSYLHWELSPLWTAGIKGQADFSGFHASVQFHAGIPGGIGSMYDSDWFDNTSVRQSLSESSGILAAAWLTDITLGYAFSFAKGTVSLMPTAGFSYHYLSITAPAGGTATTDPNPSDGIVVAYDSPDAVKANTAQLDYWRETIHVWLGLRLLVAFSERFSLSLCMEAAPFTRVLSVDHHYNNGYYFIDKPRGTFRAFRSGAELTVSLHRHAALSLGAQLTVLPTITGSTYTARREGYLGTLSTTTYAGASMLDAAVSLGVKFLF